MFFYPSVPHRPATERSKRLRAVVEYILMMFQALLALAPSLLVGAMLIIAWRASLHLGYWPSANAPDLITFRVVDPVIVPLGGLFSIAVLGAFLSIGMFPLVTLLLIRRTPLWRAIGLWAIYGAGWMCLFIPLVRDALRWYI
jgi:hypothetical protein